ncbi:hypothetical protein [Methanomethylophilus alvi]|uniref:hypothetical protein n=1 Tax=Methanomethylophilus alvi TaxID=1291540 RepID=UPI0037DBF28D
MSFRELSSSEISDRAGKINSILEDLSIKRLDSAELGEKAKILEEIYSSKYRHGYEGILDVIRNIEKTHSSGGNQSASEEDQEMDSLFFLTTNLDDLKEHIRIGSYSVDTFNGIVRLSDHVKLEIHRLRDLQEQDYQKEQMTRTIKELLAKSENLASEVKIAQNNSEKLQMHMVAILGIFAAIVMAFSGGMNLLSGSISISGDSNLCNVVFVVVLCGIILFNLIAFLIGSIMSIIHPVICDKEEGHSQKGIFNSKLLIAFNGLMMSLLAADVVIMICL